MSKTGSDDMTMGKLYHFPVAKAAQIEKETRLVKDFQQELQKLNDSGEMLAYIQLNLPDRLPNSKTRSLKLDLYYDNGRRLHILHVDGNPRAEGMPFNFAGPCPKSVMYGSIPRLVEAVPANPMKPKPIEGIKPIYIRPLAIFATKDR